MQILLKTYQTPLMKIVIYHVSTMTMTNLSKKFLLQNPYPCSVLTFKVFQLNLMNFKNLLTLSLISNLM